MTNKRGIISEPNTTVNLSATRLNVFPEFSGGGGGGGGGGPVVCDAEFSEATVLAQILGAGPDYGRFTFNVTNQIITLAGCDLVIVRAGPYTTGSDPMQIFIDSMDAGLGGSVNLNLYYADDDTATPGAVTEIFSGVVAAGAPPVLTVPTQPGLRDYYAVFQAVDSSLLGNLQFDWNISAG